MIIFIVFLILSALIFLTQFIPETPKGRGKAPRKESDPPASP